MNKERELEKIRISNYEILCIVRDCTPEQKSNLMEKVRKIVSPENLTFSSEVKKLAYPIQEIRTAEYLLLNFRVGHGRIAEVEEALKNPLIIRHMTINLDTEKKIKIKNSDKLQSNRKFRKPGSKIGKSSPEKFDKEVPQGNERQLEVDN